MCICVGMGMGMGVGMYARLLTLSDVEANRWAHTVCELVTNVRLHTILSPSFVSMLSSSFVAQFDDSVCVAQL